MGLGTWDAKRSKWKTAAGTPARSARVAAQTALLQTMRQSTEYTPAQINAEAAILAGLTAKAQEQLIVTRCDGAAGAHTYVGVRTLGTVSYSLPDPRPGQSAPHSRVCSVHHKTPPHTGCGFPARHAWPLLPASVSAGCVLAGDCLHTLAPVSVA